MKRQKEKDKKKRGKTKTKPSPSLYNNTHLSLVALNLTNIVSMYCQTGYVSAKYMLIRTQPLRRWHHDIKIRTCDINST